MAITSSAKKAIRSSAKKALFNARRKRALDRAVRDVRKLVVSGKTKEALARLPDAYQAIDKAAKAKFIKKNAASRIKSRLAITVNKKAA